MPTYSSQFYLHSLISQIINLSQEVFTVCAAIQQRLSFRPGLREGKTPKKKTTFNRGKKWKKSQEEQERRGSFSRTDRHATSHVSRINWIMKLQKHGMEKQDDERVGKMNNIYIYSLKVTSGF